MRVGASVSACVCVSAYLCAFLCPLAMNCFLDFVVDGRLAPVFTSGTFLMIDPLYLTLIASSLLEAPSACN